jgi:metal-responsive CopG/Arc/MetJ family transcriptional regulator
MSISVIEPVNITLPRDLVERLDAVVGPRQRSAFVEEAINHRLRREEMRRAWESLAGTLNPADYPDWSTPEKVQQWVRDRRAEVTSAGGT